jgi:uncharacterized protein YndB with AHSA1/START domain
MSSFWKGSETVAKVTDGGVIASVEIRASPARVFQAIASAEIVDWWVNPGIFDTRQWAGDVRVGGRWSASGMSRGTPYTLEGEYLEVDPPKKLVHTWHSSGASGTGSKVTYILTPIQGGTRLVVRHSGIMLLQHSNNICAGWRTSLGRLEEILAAHGR